MAQNYALFYKNIPDGLPVPGKDLVVEPTDFDFNAPPPPGGIMVKMCYSSLDPYLRGLMRPPEIQSYFPAFKPGQVVTSHGIAQVIKSDNPAFGVAQLVKGFLKHEKYYAIPKEALGEGKNALPAIPKAGAKIDRLDNPLGLDLRDFVAAIGMPGLTAYSSLFEIGKPQKGETIFVSAASGAVGGIVGQLAKHQGLHVIGSVGSDDKLDYIIKDLGFDAGFNYKKEAPAAALRRLAPNGLDIYYENVGGETLEAAIDAMKNFGRIVVCGMVSQYNHKPEDRYPIRNTIQIFEKRLTARGFIVVDPDFGDKWGEEHVNNLTAWIKDGSFKSKIWEIPFEQSAEGFVGMLQGKNFGKTVVRY